VREASPERRTFIGLKMLNIEAATEKAKFWTELLTLSEEFDFPWMLEMSDVNFQLGSKWVNHMGDISKMPATPISLVKTMLNEKLSRPEIIESALWLTQSGLPNRDQRDAKTSYCIELHTYFSSYLGAKYGNCTKGFAWFDGLFYELIRGKYDGVNDPELHKRLTNSDLYN